MFNILVFIISYLVASISPSIILSKKVLKQDIRELGSKNAGTTNAIRTMGKKMGGLVFVLDIFKVCISYILILLIAKLFNRDLSGTTKALYILASVLGHTFPVYYSFKGGKGVAVLLMSIILTDFKVGIICLIVGVLIIAISRFVSLGSMCGAVLLFVISLFRTSYNNWLILLVALLIIFNHRENIKRLLSGKENKLF